MKLFKFLLSFLNNVRKTLHLFLLLMIFGLIVAGLAERRVDVPETAALLLQPSGLLVEEFEGDPLTRALAEMDGGGAEQTLLRDIVDSLDAAADDERIKAVVLQLDALEGGGLAKLQTVAESILRVRESGKPVFAVGDAYTQAQYYLAAQADEIYMHPLGMLYIDGFGYYRTYLKRAIDKLKIDLNVFRVGEYKSFVEPFIRDDMSAEDKEASRRWLEALWASYQADVVEARGLEAGSLDDYANRFLERLKAANGDTGRVAVDAGLVDHLSGRQAFRNKLIEIVGESDDDSGNFSQIDYRNYLLDVRTTGDTERPKANVGVLVASGEIVDGEAPRGTIGGDTLAALVDEAARDESIKALVLRVDSPGGSMFASEVVFGQLQNLKQLGKPLIASMSSVAASGGYYISMPADEIWASESTITGSIGVGALVPTFQRGLDSLGISIDGIGTTDLAGQLRVDRELGEDAREILQMTVEDAYRVFVDKVAEQRGMSFDRANFLARGRVWIGGDAFELGLVDQLGGLEDAIDAAAALAGLAEGEYGVKYIESELSLGEQIALEFAVVVRRAVLAMGLAPMRSQGEFLDRIIGSVRQEFDFLRTLNDPKGLYYYCFCQLP